MVSIRGEKWHMVVVLVHVDSSRPFPFLSEVCIKHRQEVGLEGLGFCGVGRVCKNKDIIQNERVRACSGMARRSSRAQHTNETAAANTSSVAGTSDKSHASAQSHTRRLKYHAGSSASARRCHRSSCAHVPRSSRLYSSVGFGATRCAVSGGNVGVIGLWLTEKEKVVMPAVS